MGLLVRSGRILRFEDVRGYGFIVPDDGGPDVFVHANELGDEKAAFAPGTAVEFEVMEGDRGLKAFAVRLAGGGRHTPVEMSQRAMPSSNEDVMCDVLTPSEFRGELTELFLESVPELTGAQIVRLRESLLIVARKRGWVDE
jgi:CspA family cold shock protein